MNIKAIKKTHLDEAAVLGRSVPKGAAYNYADFERKIVPKPWGHEYLMYRNSSVEVWHLYIKEGFTTSLHCHPKKKTAMIVVSGEVIITDLNGAQSFTPPGGVMIDAGAFHSHRAISPGGAHLIEIETPPDKNDLIRLRDEARREHKAYEGTLMREISGIVCVRLPHPKNGGHSRHQVTDVEVCLAHFNGALTPDQRNFLKQYDLAAILCGSVDDTYHPTDLFSAKDFAQEKTTVCKEVLTLLFKHP